MTINGYQEIRWRGGGLESYPLVMTAERLKVERPRGRIRMEGRFAAFRYDAVENKISKSW